MTRYTVERWIRIALATMAFAMALVLTPRAILDVSGPADSHEIPVDMLEPSDECLWCTSPATFDADECDELDGADQHWLNPDQIGSEYLDSPCHDDLAPEDSSV